MTANSLLSVSKSERNQLIAATLAAIIIAIPICLMVPLYQDDFERAVSGQYYWAGDGRPISEFIYRLMSFGSPQVILTSPLGTLLCIPGISLCSLLLCRIFDHRKTWGAALAAILLFCSPYFIENLSFSFDSPMMVLSVFFSLSAAYLIVSYRSLFASFGSVFLTVCSLCLYQAANSALWIPIILFIIFRIRNAEFENENQIAPNSTKSIKPTDRSNLEIIRSLLLCMIISLLIYKIIVLPNSGLLDYAIEHGSTAEFLNIPSKITENINLFYRDVVDDWDGKFGIAFGCFLIISIFFTSLDVEIYSKYSNRKRPMLYSSLRIILRILAAFIVLIFSYGIALILEKPVFQPRAFTGIGIFLASISLLSTRYINLNNWQNQSGFTVKTAKDLLVVVTSFAAAWACIYILYAYTNAYSSQQNLNEYYLGSIANDVRRNGYGPTDIQKLAIKGKSPRSPISLNTFRSLPILKSHGRIGPVSYYWPNLNLMRYGFTELSMTNFSNVLKANQISSNPIYDLYVYDKTLFIEFKKFKRSL